MHCRYRCIPDIGSYNAYGAAEARATSTGTTEKEGPKLGARLISAEELKFPSLGMIFSKL